MAGSTSSRARKEKHTQDLKAGLITAAVERGAPERKVRLTSRHSAKSRELEEYIRPIERRRHALTSEVEL
jgi:hypothetical protein